MVAGAIAPRKNPSDAVGGGGEVAAPRRVSAAEAIANKGRRGSIDSAKG